MNHWMAYSAPTRPKVHGMPEATAGHMSIWTKAGPGARTAWDREARVGDRVALMRFQHAVFRSSYTPGIVALGEIVLIEHPEEPRTGSTVTVRYDRFFFDRPVPPHRLGASPAFGGFRFNSPHSFVGSTPRQLTAEQWEAIERESSRGRVLRRNRWDLEPGAAVVLSELVDRYGAQFAAADRWGVYENGAFYRRGSLGDSRTPVTVERSRLTPNVFVFADPTLRNAQWNEDGRALEVRVESRLGSLLCSHIETGCGIRVFAVTSSDGSTMRYIGQFVIDQQTAIEAEPRKSNAPGRCYRLLPLGKVSDDSALHPRIVGRQYEQPSSGQTSSESNIVRTISREKLGHANRMHSLLQNQLASFVKEQGLQPLSPTTSDAPFDIAFWLNDRLVLCEVKSLPVTSEVDQLRYGLGQLLEYAHDYMCRGDEVQPVLYVERRPSDRRWEMICSLNGVVLAWPEERGRILASEISTRQEFLGSCG
ncbi:hypothetical protein SK803_16090 [Lentzea sp. BCCO 10_0856]|uniref:EVE domain-containing protein n=1 Tax=Lentzea miocenica TaxID=3095431 RepID=A0ABU4T0Q3_9PSEU|nr:hypothetical protein [Lentzea sp. BCCO 10_0856]MDX8031746.1 hypothetical protein [Lentzea sp. BCCO 10_0856]